MLVLSAYCSSFMIRTELHNHSILHDRNFISQDIYILEMMGDVEDRNVEVFVYLSDLLPQPFTGHGMKS